GESFVSLTRPAVPQETAVPAVFCIALAGSAGGLAAISDVVGAVPSDFPAAVLVLLPLDPRHRSWLAQILPPRRLLDVVPVMGGECMTRGTVFVAPPDHHLLVRPGGVLHLSDSPRIHYVRPSADLLFTSLAESYGERAIAVVLSGTGFDGSDGVRAIKR